MAPYTPRRPLSLARHALILSNRERCPPAPLYLRRYFRPLMPLLTQDIEPLWIARYDYEPLWHLPPHAHDDYFQIILIVSGTGEAVIGT